MRVLLVFYFFIFLAACTTSTETPLTISLSDYKIEKGFKLDMVASEPLLKAPVAIDFDAKGRIWVVEMPGYMNDMKGSGESEPSGQIKIMEDLDNDGRFEHVKIFLDTLVMPRALKLIYGGLLYAEPPNLWFVEIENDKPAKRTLVDSLYAPDGNPEHQPNGLLLNIDNWVYCAKSNYRYQKKDGQWKKEPTSFRGQWGITKDNFGRLYFNNNSQQLLGDYLIPNRLIQNPYHIPTLGLSELLTKDQRVYPLQPTLVNRGYSDGILNKDSLLVNVTAACSPLIYRGSQFPNEYNQNAFVCVPEANLIKRNILIFEGDEVKAEQAWQHKEFLASLDEGFRPVNLNNGPDGSMYIVDMHRGVIGHHAYLSPYLKEKIKQRSFDTIVDFGRILKVSVENKTPFTIPDFDTLSEKQLVNLLKDKNGWIRDHAQHYLTHKNMSKAIPALKELTLNIEFPLSQIHALYTLEGLNALSFKLLKNISQIGTAEVVSHAIVLLEDFISQENAPIAISLFKQLVEKDELPIDLYLGTTLGQWASVSKEPFLPLLSELYYKHKGNKIFEQAILSGIQEVSKDYLKVVKQQASEVSNDFIVQIEESIQKEKQNKENPIFLKAVYSEDSRTKGVKLFREICASCHGFNGKGIKGLAPPLENSEHINQVAKLGLIMLHGLRGPIQVNGENYELNQAMPGLLYNETISDEEIADVISYVTSAFTGSPQEIQPEEVKKLRDLKPKERAEFTIDELDKLMKTYSKKPVKELYTK